MFLKVGKACSYDLNENQIEAEGRKKDKLSLCLSAFNTCYFNKLFKEICSTLGCHQWAAS